MDYERTIDVAAAVQSRIRWSAIFAGAFVAFVTILVLNTFGVALGLSVGDGQLGTGVAIWSVLVALVALFTGGCVMSYLEEHETKQEALIHAIVLWGILVVGLLMLTFSGIQMGLNLFLGAATTISDQMSLNQMLNSANELGLSQEQIAELRQRLTNFNVPSTASAWWSFIALIVSLGAVMLGARSGERVKVRRLTRLRMENRSAA